MNFYQIPTIAVMNQKGGVGKTTTAGLLAECFGLLRNKKVLIIDLDMQCNSSDQWVGMEQAPNEIGGQLPPRHPEYNPKWDVNERSTIADIFLGKAVLPYSTWLTEELGGNGRVDIMLGHPELLEQINSGETNKKFEVSTLKNFLCEEDIKEAYDVILLDTGPSRNKMFRAAIRAATHVIIPFSPEEKDIQGINAMLQVIRQENYSRAHNEELKLIGLLPNKVRIKTKLHIQNLNNIKKIYKKLLFPEKSWLSLSTSFPERDMKGARPKSVYELPASNTVKKQALSMAKMVEKLCFSKKKQTLEVA